MTKKTKLPKSVNAIIRYEVSGVTITLWRVSNSHWVDDIGKMYRNSAIKQAVNWQSSSYEVLFEGTP